MKKSQVYKPPAYKPRVRGYLPRPRAFFTIRSWSVRHSRSLEWVYDFFAKAILIPSYPIISKIGYKWFARPVAAVENFTKHILFDCRMCGDCILSSTGMSCPMNCPKQLRNGPCGGVRSNGNCEVVPEMKCVWVEAWEGSNRMKNGNGILVTQPPHDHSLRGNSAWLRVIDSEGRAVWENKTNGDDAPKVMN